MIGALLALGGCEPCGKWTETEDEQAWRMHVAAIEAEFDQSGECPTELPEVATTWGCLYEPEFQDTENLEMWGRLDYGGVGNVEIQLFEVSPEDAECTVRTDDYGYDTSRSELFLSKSPVIVPPFFVVTDSGATGYDWMCLETAKGPPGEIVAAANLPWRGSIFSHTDPRDNDVDNPRGAIDTFVAFTQLDCGYGGEDASVSGCDGRDDDLDGTIDEASEPPSCDE